MKYDFGVATCPEPVTQRFQLAAQLGVIVDLAVEDGDSIPVLAPLRLIAAFQVDNLEPYRAKRCISRLVYPVLIGPAMGERGDDSAKNTRIYSTIPMSESRNATQVTNPRFG